jgi:hypothetical protein
MGSAFSYFTDRGKILFMEKASIQMAIIQTYIQKYLINTFYYKSTKTSFTSSLTDINFSKWRANPRRLGLFKA